MTINWCKAFWETIKDIKPLSKEELDKVQTIDIRLIQAALGIEWRKNEDD